MSSSDGVDAPDPTRLLYHELRTSLHHLVSYTQLLVDDMSEEGQALSSRNRDRLQRLSRRLLASIVDAFEAPSVAGAQGQAALQAIRKKLSVHDQRFRRLLGDIITLSLAMEGDVRRHGGATAMKDLEKVIHASEKLRVILNEVQALPPSVPGPYPSLRARRSRPVAPTRDEQAAPSVSSGTPGDPTAAPGETPVVLVVDDSELNREILSRRLVAQGYSISTAHNGRAALELLAVTPTDLVLLDVMMPEMDGFAVLHAMKSSPSLRDIPVVMISAQDDIESVAVCIERGADDYLPKPFDPVLLRARVRGCLEKKRLRDREVQYLQAVARITAAAAIVESKQYARGALDDVAARGDELGQLARVFERMACEVAAREQELRAQVEELRVQIDEAEKAREVAEITETEYFQQLQLKARSYRERRDSGPS